MNGGTVLLLCICARSIFTVSVTRNGQTYLTNVTSAFPLPQNLTTMGLSMCVKSCIQFSDCKGVTYIYRNLTCIMRSDPYAFVTTTEPDIITSHPSAWLPERWMNGCVQGQEEGKVLSLNNSCSQLTCEPNTRCVVMSSGQPMCVKIELKQETICDNDTEVMVSGIKYKLFQTAANQTEAAISCIQDGGHLAKIVSMKQLNCLASAMSNQFFAVDGNDVITEGEWVNLDGSPGYIRPSVTRNNQSEKCMILDKGILKYKDCSSRSWYACSYHPENQGCFVPSYTYRLGLCYRQQRDIDYGTAIGLCAGEGGRLARIENEETFIWFKSILAGAAAVLVDGTDVISEGNWLYSNGTNAWVPPYSWKDNEPKGQTSQNCLRLSNVGFDDTSCFLSSPSLCVITGAKEMTSCAERYTYLLGACFGIHHDKVSHADAEVRCVEEGGYLARIMGDVLFQFLISDLLSANTEYHVDGNDTMIESTWVYGDGSLVWGQSSTWVPTFPVVDKSKNCRTVTNFGFMDVPCESYMKPFICEHPSVPPHRCVMYGYTYSHGICYKQLESSKKTADDAKLACSKDGGRLARLNSFNKYQLLYSEDLDANNKYFVAGRNVDGAWLYPDGTAVWGQVNGAHDCVIMEVTVGLVAKPCSEQYWALCEVPFQSGLCNEFGYIHTSVLCFKIYNDMTDWETTFKQCYEDGGQLIRVDSQEKLNALKPSLGTDDSYWVDGSDKITEGRFLYKDGTMAWASWQPDGGTLENCMEIGPTFNDAKCEDQKKFICELID